MSSTIYLNIWHLWFVQFISIYGIFLYMSKFVCLIIPNPIQVLICIVNATPARPRRLALELLPAANIETYNHAMIKLTHATEAASIVVTMMYMTRARSGYVAPESSRTSPGGVTVPSLGAIRLWFQDVLDHVESCRNGAGCRVALARTLVINCRRD